MNKATIITGVTDYFKDDPRLSALFLAGSFGRGEEDEFSDIDFVAIASSEHHDALIGKWRVALETLTTLIMWKRPYPSTPLINVVTEDWIRCDLYLISPDKLTGRAQTTVKPLIDPTDIYHSLPASLPDAKPNKDRVVAIITEFIRVIGMTPIVMGRGELVTAVQGAGLLRDMLINLMLEEVTKPDKGGAMHLSRLLPSSDYAALMVLPAPAPDRQSVLISQQAIAAVFLPRARRLATELDIDWPETFLAKTRDHLRAEVGLELG